MSPNVGCGSRYRTKVTRAPPRVRYDEGVSRISMIQWLHRPQLLIIAVLLCLLTGAAGAWVRAQPMADVPHPRPLVTNRQPSPSCIEKPCLALTFDDGPSASTTPALLDALKQAQVQATFYLVGSHVQGKAPIVQRMHADGHEIGNHTWSHPDLTTLTPGEVRAQINATQRALLEAGVPLPKTLRPPYGATNAVVESQTSLAVVRWNIDSEDWRSQNADELAARILQQAKPGGIVLLHDTNTHTVAAITQVLPQLKAHYQLLTVSELLGLTPGDQGQYFGR